jgi:tRNA (guanine37-N1)-methyltransferase
MKFDIITIFPSIFDSYFNESIIKRAQKKGLASFNIINLRNYTADRHKTVDDTPYGGGAGMVLKIEPIAKAIGSTKLKVQSSKFKVVLLSARGKKWNQQLAKKYSKLDEIIFICGRYEGVDERVKKLVDDEISVGDYVLTGGELGAMIIVDSVTRLLPGVLGNSQSAVNESHSEPGLLEYPQYTRPEVYMIDKKNHRVPKILLSGDHKKIESWRKKKMRQT